MERILTLNIIQSTQLLHGTSIVEIPSKHLYCGSNTKLHAVTDVALNLIQSTDLTVLTFESKIKSGNNDQLITNL